MKTGGQQGIAVKVFKAIYEIIIEPPNAAATDLGHNGRKAAVFPVDDASNCALLPDYGSMKILASYKSPCEKRELDASADSWPEHSGIGV